MSDLVERLREIAKRLVAEAHYGVMTNEQLEDNITAALLSAEGRARREGREEMRERAAQIAYGRCGVGETASHLGASIGDDIRAIPLEAKDV